MTNYKKTTKAEYAIISKKNYFSELLFESMGKLIQPAAKIFIWTALLCIVLILINTITNDERYIIAISEYIWPAMLFFWISIFILIIVITIFSNLLIGSLIDTSAFFEKNKDIIEPTDKIIKHLRYIHMLIWVIYWMNKFISLFSEIKAIKKINNYLRQYTYDLLNFLFDLRSDLSIHITEQKQVLESAKSEVEKNITWTTELKSVSESQQVRLNKQIEQFEELQKKLIRA